MLAFPPNGDLYIVPNKGWQRLIFQMALSKQAIVRRIGDLSANVTMSLKNDLASSVALSIALD